MITVALYATDTMADWEYGYLIAGLTMAREQNPDANRLLVASESGEAVTTMGGLRITPDVALADLPPVDALILPGAGTWESANEAALKLAAELVAAGTPGRSNLRGNLRAGSDRPARRPAAYLECGRIPHSGCGIPRSGALP